MKRTRSRWAAAALAAAFLAAVPATRSLATGAPTRAEGVPHLDHVVVIVLENQGLASTWSPADKHLFALMAQGAFASQYYAESHESADNYIAMTSGQMATPLFQADCLDWSKCETWEATRPDGGVSVADQVAGAHETWKAYMDGMPTACLHPSADPSGTVYQPDPYQSGYATRHDPFVYYPPVLAHDCADHVVPYDRLAGDISSLASTPNYAFITPDTCNDGHDVPCTGAERGQPGGLKSADAWIGKEVPKILASPAFTTPGVASVLFITTDEAATDDVTGCVTGPPPAALPGTCASGIPPAGVDGGGLVGLLAIGSPAARVAAGTSTATPYDHFSLLRTIEDGLGLGPLPGTGVFQDQAGHLNEAGSPLEHSMASLFTAS